jgi:putative tRNA adenosine deaminase-associated protein
MTSAGSAPSSAHSASSFDDEQAPAGDLGIVADLGFSAAEMGALLDDYDLYPEELLGEVASRIGFGDKFDEIVDVSD